MRSELQNEIKVPSYRMIDHKIPPAAASRRGAKKDVVRLRTFEHCPFVVFIYLFPRVRPGERRDR